MTVKIVINVYNRIKIFSSSKPDVLWMNQLDLSLFSIGTRKLHLYNFCFNALTFVANILNSITRKI